MAGFLTPVAAADPSSGGSTLLGVQARRELERGQDYQVIETIAQYREADGTIRTSTGSVTILATGMFYMDNAQLLPSQEAIEMTAIGPVARQGPHQVSFPADIAAPDSGGVVDLLTSDQKRFRSRILGLSYYNPANGQSVWVAEVQPSQAELVPPNKLIYRNAFAGVNADVLYDYRKAAFSQDVVLRVGQLPAPADVGLEGERVLFEVVTEFLQAPTPRQERRVMQLAGGLEVVDDLLDFGLYQMPGGAAFWLDVGDGDDANLPPLRMFKRWEVIEGRTFLFEQVELSAVQALLASRVVAQAEGQRARGQRSAQDRVFESRAALVRALPRLAQTQAGPSRYRAKAPSAAKAAGAAAIELPIGNSQSPIGTPQPQIGNPKSQVASSTPGTRHSALAPGLVLDWTLLLSTNNFTFKGDTTYYVPGQVNLTGTNTIEGGTVVKFTNTTSAKITFGGRVVCQTGPYRPAIFTAKDDDSVGEVIPGSTGNPTNYYGNGLWFSEAGNTLQYVNIRFADTAVSLPSEDNGLNLAHAQFVGVRRALSCSNGGVAVGNALFNSLQNVISGRDAVLRAQQLTVHQCDRFVDSRSSYCADLYLTNSLLFAITNGWGNYGSLSTNAVAFTTNDVSGVFVQRGAGWHYLPEDSPYHNVGTTNLNPTLLAELAAKTTWPPWGLSNDFTNQQTVLSPLGSYVFRDNDGKPDLGYHYDPLDFCWTGLNLTNGTLTLTNGVAVGAYGPTGTYLQNGAKFQSIGTALAPNELVRYQVVQEQPIPWGASGYYTTSLLAVNDNPLVKPEVSLKFTEVSFPANAAARRLILDTGGSANYMVGTLALRDCQVYGGALALCLYPWEGDTNMMIAGFTNNLFQRVNFSLEEDTQYLRLLVRLRNNLFFGGRLRVADYSSTGTWSVRDNLFHTNDLSAEAVPNSHNGYYRTTQLPGGASNVVVSVTDYQAGPFGSYYYPNTGVSGGLTNLLDKGSTNAGAADLYLYTIVTNQAPDGNSIVDIGYHYQPVVSGLTVTTNLGGAVDVDYNTNESALILSVNYATGYPNNFAKIDTNCNVTSWSGASGFGAEVPMTTAKTTTTNGFIAGETYFASTEVDRIARVRRISATGVYTNWWVELPGELCYPGGLYIDTTGLFGGELIVVAGDLTSRTGGDVWLVNVQTQVATLLTNAATALEGVLVCPNDATMYGPDLAGKILTGAGGPWLVYTVTTNGATNSVDLGMSPHDFHIIPPNEDFYYLDFRTKDVAPTKLLKIGREFFAHLVGDLVVVQSSEFPDPQKWRDRNGHLFVVHWTGSECLTLRITPPSQQQRWFEHSVFAPISLPTGP